MKIDIFHGTDDEKNEQRGTSTHPNFSAISAVIEQGHVSSEPVELAVLSVMCHLYRIQWDRDVSGMQRCKDVAASHGLCTSELSVAWDVVCPYIVEILPRFAPLSQYDRVFGICGISRRAVSIKIPEHACMIACVIRDVAIRCECVLRKHKKLNIARPIREWAHGIKGLRCTFRNL